MIVGSPQTNMRKLNDLDYQKHYDDNQVSNFP